MAKTMIKPYEELHRQIYGYILPEVPSHDGYVKVGDTKRETKVRVFEQVSTAGLTPKILFERTARRSDGKWFRDTDLHRFFELNGIEKAKLGTATEWYFFNGYLEKAEQLTDKYINLDYDEVQMDDSKSNYILRAEQNRAVELTLDYYNSGQEPREFLWNAKPRFGKTLTAYDFVRRIRATNVLIVTNRPAIANSWFDDFQKFIAWQEPGMKFVSETDALKGKAMTLEEFVDYALSKEYWSISQITFLSLQDLKGAKFFGGSYDKLEWVGSLNWDLLIIDEAHEGVDTELTDAAFDKIERKFTLHLSGTPFKALASNKFNKNQIFNWSYVDEQQAKRKWDYINNGSNPYENLPQLSLFTYQMSKMIEERVSRGLTLDNEENVDYAFDLNEFFRVDDRGNFEYEASVRKFLDNLCSGHFPFSEGRQRDELQHTFWLLPRVNSAKALEALLKEHPVFKDYTIVLAAGDGLSLDYDLEQEASDFKKNEKSYNKVRAAIDAAKESNGKTITLSVGQLTTGVTIPEWSAVLMLNNIKSPSLYFQAAFRAQNPYEFEVDGKLYRKENAYIFDFAPERTLKLYDEFANNLSGDKIETSDKREEGIKELLNFFPVIAEDEAGNMHELDATEVLIIPTRIHSREVVKRGFMSNLLFTNISGIFAGHRVFNEILDKMRPEKNKRLMPRRDVVVTDPMIDDDGNVAIPKEVVINKTDDLFGPGIYRIVETIDVPGTSHVEITKEIEKKFADGFAGLKKTFDLTNAQVDEVKEEVGNYVADAVKNTVADYQAEVKAITEDFTQRIEESKEKGDATSVVELEVQLAEKKEEASRVFTDNLNEEVGSTIEAAVEEQMAKVEEAKKKTTEDDVRDHLRGFARTIPAFLMAYGDENTTLDDFEKNIDEPTFEELTGITIDEFRKLRDGFEFVDDDGNNRKVPGLFNKVVFNASIQEFFATKERLSNYFDETLTEDIFDYIPPQKTNQIFTPRRVVNMMVDMLEKANPGLFSDYNTKFLDPYVKSSLYIAEIVRRLHNGLKEQIPNSEERIKWILENQVYAIAPSNIIYNIVKNFIYPDDLEISTKNLIELDLTIFLDEANWQNRITEAFGGEDLKFDVIIGNPPYQEEAKGTSSSDDPIYHLFMDQAYKLSKKVMLITPARFLFNAGKTPVAWNRKMLNDPHLSVEYYEPDSRKVFPNVQIPGGIAVTYRDSDMDYGKIGTFVVYPELNAIKKKVGRTRPKSIREIIYLQNKFNLDNLFDDYPQYKELIGSNGRDKRFRQNIMERLDVFSSERSGPDDIRVLGLIRRQRSYRYIPRKYVEPTDWLDKYKVFVPFSNGASGTLGEEPARMISTPVLGMPGDGMTQTFIGFGAFSTETEARNLLLYIKTKFARAMLGILKVTQGNKPATWKYVPLQDFSDASDIDWSKPLSEIDMQLYEKYRLDESEIRFIEERLAVME